MTTTTATRPALRSAKTVKLEPDITERVQRLATIRNRSSHWLMQEAIRQYVEREEPRELMRQDALAAWNAYQATGLHVTHAEADAWLAQLEAGHDVEPPACHV
jgi:predicted transcriptional regulator